MWYQPPRGGPGRVEKRKPEDGLQGARHPDSDREKFLIAVYQPIRTHGHEAIEEYRDHVEDLIAKSPRDTILVIGGDHNSQLSGNAARQGSYGLDTPPTNEQGMDLIQWCSEQQLQWANGFSGHNNRGTWFNRNLMRRFEIDGFLMQADQRQKHMR